MIGERLRQLRIRKKWTQEDIASRLGITRPAYTQYESSRRTPDAAMLEKLADIFSVEVDYLLGRIPFTDDQTIIDYNTLIPSGTKLDYFGDTLTILDKHMSAADIIRMIHLKFPKVTENGVNVSLVYDDFSQTVYIDPHFAVKSSRNISTNQLTGKTDTSAFIVTDTDEDVHELYKLFKNDSDSKFFWLEYKKSDPETRRKMIETWKFINELEKDRKHEDKPEK